MAKKKGLAYFDGVTSENGLTLGTAPLSLRLSDPEITPFPTPVFIQDPRYRAVSLRPVVHLWPVSSQQW